MNDRSERAPEHRHEHDGEQGLSRRQVLRRGATAGALAWTAPVVVSSRAFAAGPQTGTVRPCSRFYAVRIVRGRCHPLFPPRPEGGDDGSGTGDVCPELEAWATAHPEIVLEFPAACPQLVAAEPHLAWAVLLPDQGPDPSTACQFLVGYGRAGNVCCAGYVDPAPPDPAEAGRRIIFPQCATGELSSVQIIYCCP